MSNQRLSLIASTVLALAALGGMTGLGFAQATPQAPNYNVGDAMKQAAPPAPPTPGVGNGAAPPPALIVAGPEQPLALSGNEKVFVKSIVVSGATDEEQDLLASILTSYIDKELSMVEISQAAKKVTIFYRDRGYLVARAYVPKQDTSEGILIIGIRRGTYGAISVKNSSLVRKRVVQGTFNEMKATSPDITQASLERAMMLVQEMPGGALPNVSIEPGKAPGSTDLAVKVDEAHRFSGYLLGDNEGSQYTGRKRLYGGLEVNSPLGIADKLTLGAMTTEAKGLQNARVSYGFPLNYNGLRLAVSASRTIYALGGPYKVLDGTGSANTIEGTLSYPIRRRHNESIDILFNWAHKELYDNLNAVSTYNPRNADLGIVTVQRAKHGTIFGHNTYTTISTSVTLGQLEIVDPTQRRLGRIDGTYSKLDVMLTGETPLARSLSAKTSLAMQKDICDKVLDSSEQLFINGNGGVRSYIESASGDNGYVLNMELRYALPKFEHIGAQQTASLFFDNGAVSAQKNGTSFTNFVLTDVGAGYYANWRPAFVSVQVARTLGNITGRGETGKTRAWVQVGVVF